MIFRRHVPQFCIEIFFIGGYHQCLANFIQRSADSLYNVSINDILRVMLQLCDSTYKVIHEIFPAPETIMEKFITFVIAEKVQTLVKAKLDVKNPDGQEGYLRDLYELHKKTKTLEQSMSKYKFFRVEKIMDTLFESYLASYVQTETSFLRNRCTGMVQQYYDNVLTEWGLVKPGPIHVLPDKREFFNVSIIAAKTVPSTIGDYLKVCFLNIARSQLH